MPVKTVKKVAKNIRARNWTSAEVTLFAEVLVDEEHNFAAALEQLALKKAANNEVFTFIQKIFDQKRRKNHFIELVSHIHNQLRPPTYRGAPQN